MNTSYVAVLAQGEIDPEAILRVVGVGVTWIVVGAAFVVALFFGHLFARSKVQKAKDPIRAAFNALLGASLLTSILVFTLVLFAPSLGGDLSSAIGTAALGLVIHLLLAGLLFVTDPARGT